MIRHRLLGTQLLMGLVATAVTYAGGMPGQDGSETKAARSSDKLTFSLALPKSDVVLYEPVVLTYRVRNVSGSPVRAKGSFGFSDGYVKLWIRDENGQSRAFRSGVITCGLPGEISLARDESLAQSIIMLGNDMGAGGLAFPEPGRFAVWGEFYFGGLTDPQVIRGPEVEVRVSPMGEADRLLIEALGSKEKLLGLLGMGFVKLCVENPSAMCLQDSRDTALRFPDSAYAPALLFRGSEMVDAGILKAEPQAPTALDLSREFLERWPSHPLRLWVIQAYAPALKRAGRLDESIHWMEVFERDFPDWSPNVRGLREAIRGHAQP